MSARRGGLAASPVRRRTGVARPRALLLVALLALSAVPMPAPAQVPEDITGMSWGFLWAKFRGEYSVVARVAQYRRSVEIRLRPWFERAGQRYPPGEVALVAIKDTRTLELYARMSDRSAWAHVYTYPILGASGSPGPKLAAGDRQVPEGNYGVQALNPNSRFHLSLRLDYPNAFDRRMGGLEGRDDLGGDIAIHGSVGSTGCLAVGDAAAEDLFVLAALVPRDRVRVLIAPTDLRERPPPPIRPGAPGWVPELYASLQRDLRQFTRRF